MFSGIFRRQFTSLDSWQHRVLELRRSGIAKWDPQKKLTREQMDQVRSVAQLGGTAGEIAAHFGVSAESVRRILRSKWQPAAARLARQERNKEERKRVIVGEIRAQSGVASDPPAPTTRRDPGTDTLVFGEGSAAADSLWHGVERKMHREHAAQRRVASVMGRSNGVRIYT